MYIKDIVFIKNSMKTDILERVPMSLCCVSIKFFLFCKQFSWIAFSWNNFHNSLWIRLKFDIHLRIHGWKRTPEKKATIFIFQELYSKIVATKMRYKMCNNFKSIKAMIGNIPYICRRITSKICAKFQ